MIVGGSMGNLPDADSSNRDFGCEPKTFGHFLGGDKRSLIRRKRSQVKTGIESDRVFFGCNAVEEIGKAP